MAVGIAVVMTVLMTAGACLRLRSMISRHRQAGVAKEAIGYGRKNIISGMPDGTFRPADSIKKLDSLILVAKVLGANDPSKQGEVAGPNNSTEPTLTTMRYTERGRFHTYYIRIS